VLKFTYSNLEIQFFSGGGPPSPQIPTFQGGVWKGEEQETGMGKGKGKRRGGVKRRGGKGQGRKGNGEGCSPQTKIYHYTTANNINII